MEKRTALEVTDLVRALSGTTASVHPVTTRRAQGGWGQGFGRSYEQTCARRDGRRGELASRHAGRAKVQAQGCLHHKDRRDRRLLHTRKEGMVCGHTHPGPAACIQSPGVRGRQRIRTPHRRPLGDQNGQPVGVPVPSALAPLLDTDSEALACAVMSFRDAVTAVVPWRCPTSRCSGPGPRLRSEPGR
jgi:hypothetical protein